MKTSEICPHCNHEQSVETTDDSRMTTVCPKCGKVYPLCNRCATMHGDGDERPCDDCPVCDLANYMNYLRGKVTAEELLGSMNPPLTDMTSGIPEDKEATLEDYLNDTYGDDAQWDVKYWDAYRMVKESFLNGESSEADCRDFVERLIEFNRK